MESSEKGGKKELTLILLTNKIMLKASTTMMISAEVETTESLRMKDTAQQKRTPEGNANFLREKRKRDIAIRA